MRQLKLASLLMTGILIAGCAGTTKKTETVPPPPVKLNNGVNASGLGGAGAGTAQEYGAGGANGAMGAGGSRQRCPDPAAGAACGVFQL